MKKKVLVTGANGFVGSNIVRILLENRFSVYALVRKTSDLTYLRPFFKKINLVFGDVRDKDSLRDIFKKVEIVIHAAAYASDWGRYHQFCQVNITGTKNVCELALEHRIKHLIHISSISVYGFNKRINADERTAVIQNKYYYCRSKLEGERTVCHFMNVFHLNATIIQPGQIYGPNDRTMTYPMIEAILKWQYAVGDSGKHYLSPLYIDNLLQAILLILKKPKKSLGETYIITDNVKISWAEYTRILCDLLGARFPWINIPRWLGFVVAFLSESVYKFLRMKTPPLVTAYRVALVTSEFHFVPKKIMGELGYRPDQNIKSNLRKTVEAYYQSKREK
ncbi:MAG: NAD-dependent epimerase/dehydratase family protein [Spirochaetes bacterium]|nr:NAD-dependent epimerase/dehydratase family protein [Spirochaetota bacterium]